MATQLNKNGLVLICNHCMKPFKQDGMPKVTQLSKLRDLNEFANKCGWHVYGSGMGFCPECAKTQIEKV